MNDLKNPVWHTQASFWLAPVEPRPSHYKFLATPMISEVAYLLGKFSRINYNAYRRIVKTIKKRGWFALHTGFIRQHPFFRFYKSDNTSHNILFINGFFFERYAIQIISVQDLQFFNRT